MKDTAFRILNYVEVVYLVRGLFESRKFSHYPKDEAERMYVRTVAKLRAEKRPALVQLREENHQLIKSEKVCF